MSHTFIERYTATPACTPDAHGTCAGHPDAVNRTLPMSTRRKLIMQSTLQVTLFGLLGDSPALQLPGLEGPSVAIPKRPCGGWSPISIQRALPAQPRAAGRGQAGADRVLERWADIHEGLLLDVEVHGNDRHCVAAAT